MSVLALPRLHFAGSWTVNPCTTNNDDVNLYNDYSNMNVINEPSNITTDAEFRWWMQQLKTGTGTPMDGQYINAGWNYFGDSTITFSSDEFPPPAVTMACLPGGAQVLNNDPIIGALVSLTGNNMGDKQAPAVMVDVDPASNYSVQIFAANFQVEIPDGQGGFITLLSNTNPSFMPMYARFMTLSRNVQVHGDEGCSVIWQFGIPTSNLTINPNVISPTLNAFAEALTDPGVQGILVQFDCFLVTHTYSGPDLYNKFFANGIEQANPAYGPIVGTVGLWYQNELETEPSAGNRLMYPIVSFDPNNKNAPQLPNLPGIPVMSQAVAAVDTNRQVVILNLANTLPETAPFDPTHPYSTKYQYGDNMTGLELVAGYMVNGTYQTAHLAYLPYANGLNNPYSQYNTDAYAQSGGFVELSYAGSPGAPYVNSGQLALMFQGQPMLVEIEYDNVMGDQFGVYVNQGDSVDITVRTELGGGPSTSQVGLQEWRCIVVPADEEPCKSNALGGFGFATCQFTVLPDANYPPILSFPSQVTTDGNGNATFTVQALQAGISFIRFIPPPPTTGYPQDQVLWQLATLNQNDSQNPYNDYPTWQYDMYIAVRVLPLDSGYNDPSDPNYIPDEALVGEAGFDNYLYPLVFRYYYLLYPGMSKRINFSSYAEVKANASVIKTFVRKGNTSNTLYMPITRDLSDGKRILIQRWCAINE